MSATANPGMIHAGASVRLLEAPSFAVAAVGIGNGPLGPRPLYVDVNGSKLIGVRLSSVDKAREEEKVDESFGSMTV